MSDDRRASRHSFIGGWRLGHVADPRRPSTNRGPEVDSLILRPTGASQRSRLLRLAVSPSQPCFLVLASASSGGATPPPTSVRTARERFQDEAVAERRKLRARGLRRRADRRRHGHPLRQRRLPQGRRHRPRQARGGDVRADGRRQDGAGRRSNISPPRGRPRSEGSSSASTARPTATASVPFYELHVWAWKPNPTGRLRRLEPGRLVRRHDAGDDGRPPLRGSIRGRRRRLRNLGPHEAEAEPSLRSA